MTRIAIIVGSTRPNRNAPAVADWVYKNAQDRTDAEFELVDIADYDLPLLDEPNPPAMGQYENEHTKKWAEKIASFDGYIFVTPEYNHSVPGAIKNAVEELWNVRVVKVRTQTRKGKPRRNRFRKSQTQAWKKAIITLDPEHRIDFF